MRDARTTSPAPKAEAPDDPHSGDRGVQSVTRAIALIASLVGAEEGLTLTELARSTGLSGSTTHRLLQSLCDGDVLCRHPGSGRFIPGPLLIRIARTSIVNGGLSEAAQVLQELAEQTRETTSFGIRDGNTAMVLIAVPSPEPLRFDRRAGARLPLHQSALGRALLAFDRVLDEASVREVLPGDMVDAGTPSTVDLLMNQLRATRYRRWAYSNEECDRGVRGIAAPVLGGDHAAHTAIAIEGPSTRLPDERLDQLGSQVIEAARKLRHLPISLAAMGPMHDTAFAPESMLRSRR